MADQLQAIKRRMKSVGSTERITGAMKLVSAAKLKQASRKYEYVQTNLKQVSAGLKTAIDANRMALATAGDTEYDTLYLVITSSRGLCGSYNMTICKTLNELVNKDNNYRILPIGSKGKEFCIRENLMLYKETDTDYTEEISYEEIIALTDKLLHEYRSGKFSALKVVYAGYVNSISYEVRTKTLLPFDSQEEETDAFDLNYFTEYEPSGEAMINYLLKTYLQLQLYSILCETAVCEHGARRLAMKNASDNAEAMLSELSVHYNRARQAAITGELIEIIAGSEAQR